MPESDRNFDFTSLCRRFGWMDTESGFMNACKSPITRLSDPEYQPWETAIELLPHLLLASRIRIYIDNQVESIAIEAILNFSFISSQRLS